MNLNDSVKSAWSILSRNKIRSFLTMLGIIIGVMSVVVIMSVGAGAQSLILNQVKSLGSNLLGVLPGKSEEKGPPVSVLGVVITTLKNDDAKALMAGENPHLTAVSVYVRGIDTVVWGNQKTDTNFLGVSASYTEVEDAKVAVGQFFTEEDEQTMGRVAILGSQVASDLFGDANPIGEQIKVKKTIFSIIGVMAPRGVSGFQNQDNQIFIPVTTAQKLLLGINHVSFMRIKIDDEAYINDSISYVENVLRDRHGITDPADDDFTVRSTAQGLEALSTITNALRFFLAAVASIALVVGGFGIMNIMLAAVEERTKEIGLRKAIGAKHKDIIRQFLVETMSITFFGGLVGIALGILISIIVALIAQSKGYSWDLVVSYSSLLLACAVSIGIGLIFGIAPARRASKLSPIEALRYE